MSVHEELNEDRTDRMSSTEKLMTNMNMGRPRQAHRAGKGSSVPWTKSESIDTTREVMPTKSVFGDRPVRNNDPRLVGG